MENDIVMTLESMIPVEFISAQNADEVPVKKLINELPKNDFYTLRVLLDDETPYIAEGLTRQRLTKKLIELTEHNTFRYGIFVSPYIGGTD